MSNKHLVVLTVLFVACAGFWLHTQGKLPSFGNSGRSWSSGSDGWRSMPVSTFKDWEDNNAKR